MVFSWSRFTIRTKLLLGLLVVFLLFALVGFFSIWISAGYLRDAYGDSMVFSAEVMLDQMAKIISNRMEQLHIFASQPLVRRSLTAANEHAAGLADLAGHIRQVESNWASGSLDSFSSLIQGSTLSRELTAQFITFFERTLGYDAFSEVFITNRYGLNMAQTGKTEDYYQADEEWWRQAMEQGEYFGGVDYDISVDGHVLSLALRVDDGEGRPQGVIKALVSARWIVREVEVALRKKMTTQIRLATRDGALLYSTQPFRFFEDVSTWPFFIRAEGETGYFTIEEGGQERIYAYASAPGRELGLAGWKLFVGRNVSEVMRPMFYLEYSLIFIYAAMALVILGFILAFARSFTRPLTELGQAAQALAAGNMDHRAEVFSADELGQLARSFNHMAGQLAESYRLLEKEIAEKTSTQVLLTEKAKELARSNQELQDFAYIASHDLQEPLRKVMAFGDRLMARERASLSERGKDYIERMQRAAARMSGLINDLLGFSRVTTQAKPFEEVDLSEVAAGVAEDLEEAIGESGAEVAWGELPVIEAEPLQMRQLFQNIIGNALKFHASGVSPRVEISARKDGKNLVLSFQDNGIGFDEKYLERVFKPFQRLHGREEYPGSGMGMAIVNKIVLRHGGGLTAKSAPGRGATFIVTLPLKQPK